LYSDDERTELSSSTWLNSFTAEFAINNNNNNKVKLDEVDKQPAKFLTYDQLHKCLLGNNIKLKEINIFYLTWKWIYQNINLKKLLNTKKCGNRKMLRSRNACLNMIRNLMRQIRFALITPKDLVEKVQSVNELMTSDKCLRQMILNALNYHLLPVDKLGLLENINIRSPLRTIVTIGGKLLFIFDWIKLKSL
jgi:hypothetical protein